MILRSLLPEARRRLLTDEFLHGQRPRWSEQECADLVAEIERTVSIEAFCEVVERASSSGQVKAEADGRLAVEIHRSLRLRRREAADVGVWRYLAISVAPELIRRRWRAEEKTFRARFWRPGTRPDSNYYSRLWWIAELTSGADGDYDRTRKVLSGQARATAIFVRSLSHYFPAVKACAEVLADEQSETVAHAVRELFRELALLPREALTDVDIAEILRGEVARVKAERV